MDLSLFAAKIVALKGYVGAGLVLAALGVAAMGVLRVPAQQEKIAEALETHNAEALSPTSKTNAKLDVLVCLQAKLDTPIRCVARDR